MKAAWYSALGPAAAVLQFGDLPKPDIGADDVLVELTFSGANPSDVKARGGARPGVTKPQFDRIIPHSDGSGIITEVGSNISPLELDKGFGFGMDSGSAPLEPLQNLLRFLLSKLLRCLKRCPLKLGQPWAFRD